MRSTISSASFYVAHTVVPDDRVRAQPLTLPLESVLVQQQRVHVQLEQVELVEKVVRGVLRKRRRRSLAIVRRCTTCPRVKPIIALVPFIRSFDFNGEMGNWPFPRIELKFSLSLRMDSDNSV